MGRIRNRIVVDVYSRLFSVLFLQEHFFCWFLIMDYFTVFLFVLLSVDILMSAIVDCLLAE